MCAARRARCGASCLRATAFGKGKLRRLEMPRYFLLPKNRGDSAANFGFSKLLEAHLSRGSNPLQTKGRNRTKHANKVQWAITLRERETRVAKSANFARQKNKKCTKCSDRNISTKHTNRTNRTNRANDTNSNVVAFVASGGGLSSSSQGFVFNNITPLSPSHLST